MIKKTTLGSLVAAAMMALPTLAVADEGMWVLHHIDPRTQQTMQQLGLQLSSQELYDPESGVSLKDAVVDFGDFCSGVVVSPDGLVFTNHHCGYESIQSLSTTDDDILKNGFVAHSFAEERPAKDLSVFFLQRTEDVTARMQDSLAAVRKAHPEYTAQQLAQDETDRILSEISNEYREANPKMDVRAQSFCGGSQFYVSIYKVYSDIRLVFTPTETMGKFGGDTDNWMWPRQTCDFSVFRIYADKDGNPADYSADNVPLHPKRWAKVSIDGYGPGDYCMTIGYPGGTERYLSSYGITEMMEQQNKPRIEVRGLKQDIWTKWMKSDRTIGLQYASKFANSSNYWKNSIGMNQALTNLGVVAQKQNLEKRIQEWVKTQDQSTQERFDSIMPRLEKCYQDRQQMMRNLMYLSEAASGCEFIRAAKLADNLSLCQDSASTRDAIKAYEDFLKDYDARVDEETTTALLRCIAEKVDTAYLPDFIDTIRTKYNGDYAAYVHNIFTNTKVVSLQPATEQSVSYQDPISQVILAGKSIQDDPAIKFRQESRLAAMNLMADFGPLSGTTEYNEDLLTQAFLEMEQQQPHYSDANFSMRLSYGIIQDYTADGQHFQYYTNAQSLLDKAAKQNENEDYLLEDNLVNLVKKGDFGRYADKRTGEMQLCFISNNDITGGNSGSPMFNGKGELIGLAFDGNWEAMSGDISFDPALQRCIGVDIRFVLYLIDKWGHADNLIKELGL